MSHEKLKRSKNWTCVLIYDLKCKNTQSWNCIIINTNDKLIITVLSSLQSSFCFSIERKKASKVSENVIHFYGLLFPPRLLNLIVKQLRASFVENLKSRLNDTIKGSSSSGSAAAHSWLETRRRKQSVLSFI